MIRSYNFLIRPNADQSRSLDEMLDVLCDLYNAALQQRVEAYQRRTITLRFLDQSKEMKATRSSDERLAKYSYTAGLCILRRLDKTFSAFFARMRKGAKPGFPRFRSKARWNSADICVGDGLSIRKTKRLRIVGIPGEVKVRWHRDLPPNAEHGTAVIIRKAGRWYISFRIKSDDQMPSARSPAPVGIDLGLTSYVALSNGDLVSTPQFETKAAKSMRRAQRTLARKCRNSRRYRKAKLRVARLRSRIASQRQDFAHKLSRCLVGKFTHIAMEDLNIQALAASVLARSINNAAWGQFTRYISYKAECAGSVLVLVDPRRTSQTCPKCGVVKAKALKTRVHHCECGCTLDRDVAAAQVILQRANFPHGVCGQTQSQRVAA